MCVCACGFLQDIKLIESNARVGADIALEYSRMVRDSKRGTGVGGGGGGTYGSTNNVSLGPT